MLLEMLMVFCTLNFSSPKIEPNPFDYRVNIGYEIKNKFIKSDALFEIERINDLRYTNRSHNHDFKYFIVGEYVKMSKEISQQKAILKYPFVFNDKTLNVGIAVLWKDYREEKMSMYMNFNSKFLDFELSGLEKIYLAKCKLKYSQQIRPNLFIEPEFQIFYSERVDYFGNMKLVYKIKNKSK